jgi:hypothetical protein
MMPALRPIDTCAPDQAAQKLSFASFAWPRRGGHTPGVGSEELR